MSDFLRKRVLRTVPLLVLCLVIAGCQQASLLEGLDERQANEVVSAMLHNNIAAEKRNEGKGAFAVRVSRSDLPEAIELVQRDDLPSAPRTQISAAFPADAMVSTPTGERARLLSAIEQRLEESLSVLEGVKTARVHVSYDAPTRTGNQASEPEMHVAAVVVHEGSVDEQALLQSVKRFLRNAFVQVDYDNVSVILTGTAPPRSLSATMPENDGARGTIWAILVAALAGAVVFAIILWRGAGRLRLADRFRQLRRRWNGRRQRARAK
jgi:type III secretion system YscJ/HrcJ family lipoprotein